MTEVVTRPNATPNWIRRALFVLLALAVLFLALSTERAEAATTFTVNRTGDASDRDINNARCDTSTKRGNQCTLRAAMEEANDTAGADTIEFDIGSGTSVRTVSPASALPTITDAVTIDGYTQRGARENTLTEGTNAVLKVQLDGTNAGTGTDGLTIEASDSTVRGIAINRFSADGLVVAGAGATNNRIEGNFIGSNASGTADRGNAENGVSLQADETIIGGTQPARRNLISGNASDGVVVFGDGTGTEVRGNLIGTTADGTGALGNTRNGVAIGESEGNTVGGAEPATANTIAFNDERGVSIGGQSDGNTVLSNEIFSNGGLGIDLNIDGVTPNDAGDQDIGENALQNFPVIGSATRSTTTGFTAITGTLDSTPNQVFLIQCFLTEETADASGHGEGAILLDTTTRSTNSFGGATFQCDSRVPEEEGQMVSATATKLATGDTSEFSANETIFEP